MYRKVHAAELESFYRADIFKFEDTSQIKDPITIIGQDRAMEAISFGISCKYPRYNIFLSGATGTGRRSYARHVAAQAATNEPRADDWCYIYNFEDTEKPLAINFEAGEGEVFATAVQTAFEQLNKYFDEKFNDKAYEQAKLKKEKEFDSKRKKMMAEFTDFVESEYGIIAQLDEKAGTYNMTVLSDGNVLSEDEIEKLPLEQQEKIDENLTSAHIKEHELYRQIYFLRDNIDQEYDKLDQEVVESGFTQYFGDLQTKYHQNTKLDKYLKSLKKLITKNIDIVKGDDVVNPDPKIRELYWEKLERFANCFKVNVFVRNGSIDGAPVVNVTNPTHANLLGRIEYESDSRRMLAATNHTLIKEGAVHRANGGYLIINAADLQLNAWEALKRVLKTGFLELENTASPDKMSLKPERIPINMKVLLVGNPGQYAALMTEDADFAKLFKIYANFEDEMPNTEANAYKLACFISKQVRDKKMANFTKDAVAELLRYCCGLAGSQEKISLHFNALSEIMQQADVWRKLSGQNIVDKHLVKKAIEEKIKRVNAFEEYRLDLIKKGKMLIDTKGKKIGEINGLGIWQDVDHAFGAPSKITVNTYLGTDGVVNIERENNTSGAYHSKGILTLSGYIGGKYAQDIPLNLSASIAMEQNLYIDGDSASSTELYALLSSISGIPVKQSIAVTGSVNQKGEIQPIGGVSEKITGFYNICKQTGLDGSHGVMIPIQNIDGLILSDEIIEAIKSEQFTIYPVKNIDEGIEILTDVQAGIMRTDGTYPEDSVHGAVMNKLRENTEKMKKFAK